MDCTKEKGKAIQVFPIYVFLKRRKIKHEIILVFVYTFGNCTLLFEEYFSFNVYFSKSQRSRQGKYSVSEFKVTRETGGDDDEADNRSNFKT